MKADFETIEQQIQHASTSTISNFASIAKRASEIEDGANKCYFNNVSKCLILKYGNKPMTECLQLGTNDGAINNVQSINFGNNSSLKGLTSDFEISNPNNYAPTIAAITLELENYAKANHNHDSVYASINHNHDSVYASINHNHDSVYAAFVHYHDERYALLNNIVSEIQSITAENSKIPNVQAVKAFCANFLTASTLQPAIANNSQLQELIRGHEGKSAFEVWAEHQPVRYDPNDNTTIIPYTYSEYIAAISGATGTQGPQGEQGLSAYEVWCSLQQPTGYDQQGNPIYPTVQEFFEALSGETFIEWYCRVREADISEITWSAMCEDIVKSASVSNGNGGTTSVWEILFGAGEAAFSGYTLIQCKTDITALQATAAALQSQIFVLQGAVGSILSTTVGDTAIEGFDEVVDEITTTANNLTGGTSTNAFQGIQNMFSDLWNNVINPSSSTLSSVSSNISNSVVHVSLI